ncbi:MAG: hypothetical protein KME64_04120 [Scytonematopsis contorta HA4267-MV1]|jgi:hypothetical protein|nr:hypothetical protein [Scytonematopsis contorta HA4267-MV1]
MSKVEFAPIVYGRTYEVDFRFIVVPEDFQQGSVQNFQLKDRDWLEGCIRTTTLQAERLPGNPRWSIFKNKSHCIVGVTCMAAEVSLDNIKDKESRPLYVFLGYVCRPCADFQPIPMVLDHFKDLYRYVSETWEERPYEANARVPNLAHYNEFDFAESQGVVSTTLDEQVKLNLEPNKIRIWPDSTEFRQKLWLAASACQAPVSLCLGLPNEAAALNGRSLNCTTLDFNVVRELERKERPQQRDLHNQQSAPSFNKFSLPSPIEEEQQEPEQQIQFNQDTEVSFNKRRYPLELPSARSERQTSRSQEGKKNPGFFTQLNQAGQAFLEFLRVDIYDNYEDEDWYEEDQAPPSHEDENLEGNRKKVNFQQRHPRVRDTSSEQQKGIDIGFKPKKANQNDPNSSKDWF